MSYQPIIAVHANVRHIDPILRVYEEMGARIVRRTYDIEEIETPNEAHLIWGLGHRPEVYQNLKNYDAVYFMENGWFTQSSGCYIDQSGPNAMSSIRGQNLNIELQQDDIDFTKEKIESLHDRTLNKDINTGSDYIFVPLQVERDTQILYWSGCQARYPRRQSWFIDKICEAFPDFPIVIRPHPKNANYVNRIEDESKFYKNHPNVQFRSDGSSYDWIKSSRAVIGINSTVLLEALTFYKPVLALGEGIFSENSVVLEAKGNTSILRDILSYQPDVKKVESFLHYLLKTQISYKLKKKDAARHPVFCSVLEKAKSIASETPDKINVNAIDLGCGRKKPRPGYTGIDINVHPWVDIVCNAWEIDEHIPAKTVSSIYSRHLLQTLTYLDAERTIAACSRVLKSGGLLRIIVPDMRFHFDQILNKDQHGLSGLRNFTNRRHAINSLWGWQNKHKNDPNCIHRSGYDFDELFMRLTRYGFHTIERQKSDEWNLDIKCICK